MAACLHELIMQHGVWVAAGGVQKLLQALQPGQGRRGRARHKGGAEGALSPAGAEPAGTPAAGKAADGGQGAALKKGGAEQAFTAGARSVDGMHIAHLAGTVVSAVCAQHIQLLQPQVPLNGAQRLHLQASGAGHIRAGEAGGRVGSRLGRQGGTGAMPGRLGTAIDRRPAAPRAACFLPPAAWHWRTWQPTPMNSRRLTSGMRASTVARTLRLGDRVGLTPRAARMSALLRATTWRQAGGRAGRGGRRAVA